MHPIQTLKNEHARIRAMLSCFEAQLIRFERVEQPDYEILESSIDYCQEYLNCWHHPSEDVLFDLLKQRDPGRARACEDLADQHVNLSKATRRLVNIFAAVERDVPFRRSDLVEQGRGLLKAYYQHLEWEEMNFYPVIEEVLTHSDWQAIDKCLAGRIDPLTKSPVDQRYKALFNAINRVLSHEDWNPGGLINVD